MRSEQYVQVFDYSLTRISTRAFVKRSCRGKGKDPLHEQSLGQVLADITMLSGQTMKFGELVNIVKAALCDTPSLAFHQYSAEDLAAAISEPTSIPNAENQFSI
jgi:hypothetical protein